MYVADVDLRFEVEACNNFVESRQHVRWYHDVHSLVNSEWSQPETELQGNKYALVVYTPNFGIYIYILF